MYEEIEPLEVQFEVEMGVRESQQGDAFTPTNAQKRIQGDGISRKHETNVPHKINKLISWGQEAFCSGFCEPPGDRLINSLGANELHGECFRPPELRKVTCRGRRSKCSKTKRRVDIYACLSYS